MAVVKLALADVRLDGGTQIRVRMSDEVISNYAERYKTGEPLPPVVAFNDGTDVWCADGFHRCRAAEAAGVTEIDVDLEEGSKRKALEYALGANAEHGLPRSRDDVRAAVLRALGDIVWKDCSSREIGKICKVHHSTVERYRQEVSGVQKAKAAPQPIEETPRSAPTTTVKAAAPSAAFADHVVGACEGDTAFKRLKKALGEAIRAHDEMQEAGYDQRALLKVLDGLNYAQLGIVELGKTPSLAAS